MQAGPRQIAVTASRRCGISRGAKRADDRLGACLAQLKSAPDALRACCQTRSVRLSGAKAPFQQPGKTRARRGNYFQSDRVGDIAELLQGTDPNVPEGGVAVDEPRFGCYCSSGPAPRSSTAGGAAWLAALGLSGFRRRAVRRLRDERKP